MPTPARSETLARRWRTRRRSSVVAALGLLTMTSAVLSCTSRPAFNGSEIDPPHEAPEISGLNWDGHPFRLSDHRGKVAIVSFGYSFCPDVCPLTLWKMKTLYSRLGERTSEVEFVFVSVDPGRDTPEKLRDYVRSFDPRFFGIHLGDRQLETTTESYEVMVRHVPYENPANRDGSYNIDHTGTYFVLDRRGRVRLHFPPDATVDELLPDLLTLIAET